MLTKKENNSKNNDEDISSWDYPWQPIGSNSNLKIKDSQYLVLTSLVQEQRKNNYGK